MDEQKPDTEKEPHTNAVSDENYENLADAIIKQALMDYRDALVKLHKLKSKNTGERLSKTEKEEIKSQRILAESEIESIKRFFHSSWFSTLTRLNGGTLLAGVEWYARR